MNSINSNVPSSMINVNDVLNKLIGHNDKNVGNKGGLIPDNLGACTVAQNMMTSALNFDSIMDNVVNFNDMLSYTQDRFSFMRAQGESLLELINRAHSGEESEESLKSINAEAASIVAEINNIFQNSEFNGVNPFTTPFGLTIPNWQNVVREYQGVDETEAAEESSAENAITNLIADINFNFDISGDFGDSTLNMQGSASIKIGFTDDGALQISVDASLDFDLSGVVDNGTQSNNAMDILNQFLDLIMNKQNDMNAAQDFINKLFGMSDTETEKFIPAAGNETSSQISGRIVQQAAITLDGANQMPNIAINIL